MGLRTDSHLTTHQYGCIGSIFYAGYLSFEYPHNLLFQKIPVTKYLSVCVTLWGIVLCCMTACTNYPSLMIVRLFSDLLEGAVTPGFVLITSRWYRAPEHTTRIGIWFTFNGITQIIGGAVVYGITQGLELNSYITFPWWKVIFLVCGLLTTCYEVAFWWMQDSAVEARWLSEEKGFAIERLRVNQQGLGNRKFKVEQFREALTDVRVNECCYLWLYVLFTLACEIPSGGITAFLPILIQSYGFSTTETLLISMPAGVVQIIDAAFFCWIVRLTNKWALTAAASMVLSIFGPALMLGLAKPSNPLNNHIGQLVGYYITIGNSAPSFIIILGMIGTNTAGHTKKTTVSAMTLIAYCVGFLCGPQIFIDGLHYRKAKFAVMGCWVISFLACVALWWVNGRENRRKDRGNALDPPMTFRGQKFMDMTDKQNRSFRYAW